MDMVKSLAELKNLARKLPSRRVAVVRADEVETLTALGEAVRSDMVDAVLIGPSREIRACAEQAGFDLNGIEIIECPDDPSSALKEIGRAHV